MATDLAHRGPHAGRGIDWPPDQLQSGIDTDGSPASSLAGPLARGLGWFSLGLGLAELLAPRSVAKMIGVPPTTGTLAVTQLMGVRELVHGLGILSSDRPAPWVWTRVAGDALDLGLLSRNLDRAGANRTRVAGAMLAVAGTTLGDLYDSTQLPRTAPAAMNVPMRVATSITINRSADDLYRYWRDLENLPDVMTHLKSVEDLGAGISRWTVRAPLGSSGTWDAEIVEDAPGVVVAWESLPGSDIPNSGEVRFKPAPGDRGTELHVLLHYEAPAGPIGAAVLKLFGDDPVQQVKDDIRRFKQVMETGQVVRSDGAAHGMDARSQPKQRPARPHSN
ncbi:MAG: cyclase [Thermoleophilia bacterium]|nr:cyclase [Thermoleophilia bacterium]